MSDLIQVGDTVQFRAMDAPDGSFKVERARNRMDNVVEFFVRADWYPATLLKMVDASEFKVGDILAFKYENPAITTKRVEGINAGLVMLDGYWQNATHYRLLSRPPKAPVPVDIAPALVPCTDARILTRLDLLVQVRGHNVVTVAPGKDPVVSGTATREELSEALVELARDTVRMMHQLEGMA